MARWMAEFNVGVRRPIYDPPVPGLRSGFQLRAPGMGRSSSPSLEIRRGARLTDLLAMWPSGWALLIGLAVAFALVLGVGGLIELPRITQYVLVAVVVLAISSRDESSA